MASLNDMSNCGAMQDIAACLTCQYRRTRVPAESVRHPESVMFMRCVMEALGVATVQQLVNLLAREGLLDATELRKIQKWNSGATSPRFASALLLLRRAGLLTPDAMACLDKWS